MAVSGVVSSGSVVVDLDDGAFNDPAGVGLDGRGNVFVGDSNGSKVWEIGFAAAPSLNFASTAVGSTSSPQTVTVTNYGNGPLTFEVPGTGSNCQLLGRR